MKIDFQRALTAPPGAREVVLVRHGSCDPPAPDGLIDGRSDPGLNERGRAEAAAAAGVPLGGEAVAAIHVSPMARTTETAAPIIAEHQVEPIVTPTSARSTWVSGRATGSPRAAPPATRSWPASSPSSAGT